jgi:hypothetical protein
MNSWGLFRIQRKGPKKWTSCPNRYEKYFGYGYVLSEDAARANAEKELAYYRAANPGVDFRIVRRTNGPDSYE